MGKKHLAERILAPQLVLNGSEQRLQLVLAENGALLAAEELAVGGSAMQHLAPALDGLLKRLGLPPAELAGIACVRGPGGFTGLRMILALGLGLSRAANVPLAGLDYLPLIAAGPAALLTGTLAVITHARSRQVYVQTFSAPDATPLDHPRPLSLEQATAVLAKLPGPVAVVGSGWRNNAEFLTQALPNVRVLDQGFDNPLPGVLARAAAKASYSMAAVEPLYLRASDAEDNLAAIAATRGLDPAEAEELLAKATSTIVSPGRPDAC